MRHAFHQAARAVAKTLRPLAYEAAFYAASLVNEETATLRYFRDAQKSFNKALTPEDWQWALKNYEEALRRDKAQTLPHADIKTFMAHCHIELGDHEAASACLDSCPRPEGTPNADDIRTLLLIAGLYRRISHFRDARQALLLIPQDQRDAAWFVALARNHSSDRQPEYAALAYDRAAALDIKSVTDVHYDYLGCLFDAGRHADVVARYEHLSMYGPMKNIAKAYAAYSCARLGHDRQAAGIFKDVDFDNPDIHLFPFSRASMISTYAQSLINIGSTPAAVALLQSKVRDEDARDMHITFIKNKSLLKHVAQIEQLIACGRISDMSMRLLQNDLGTIYTDSGDFAQAEKILKNVIQNAPNESHAYHNLLRCYTNAGRKQDYIRLCEIAAQTFPEDPMFQVQRIINLHDQKLFYQANYACEDLLAKLRAETIELHPKLAQALSKIYDDTAERLQNGYRVDQPEGPGSAFG